MMLTTHGGNPDSQWSGPSVFLDDGYHGEVKFDS
jgi:hypothetical protein